MGAASTPSYGGCHANTRAQGQDGAQGASTLQPAGPRRTLREWERCTDERHHIPHGSVTTPGQQIDPVTVSTPSGIEPQHLQAGGDGYTICTPDGQQVLTVTLASVEVNTPGIPMPVVTIITPAGTVHPVTLTTPALHLGGGALNTPGVDVWLDGAGRAQSAVARHWQDLYGADPWQRFQGSARQAPGES